MTIENTNHTRRTMQKQSWFPRSSWQVADLSWNQGHLNFLVVNVNVTVPPHSHGNGARGSRDISGDQMHHKLRLTSMFRGQFRTGPVVVCFWTTWSSNSMSAPDDGPVPRNLFPTRSVGQP